MEDQKIVELYWRRSQRAIAETKTKYGRYCQTVAQNILDSPEDSEECVNDTYLRAWNSMPPHRPAILKTYLGKITRNLALNRFKARAAGKRGSGQVPLALEELQECIPGAADPAGIVEDLVLVQLLDQFLGGLPEERRRVFMRRYWYLSSIKEIAAAYGMGESQVKMSLLRSRNELKTLLERSGVSL